MAPHTKKNFHKSHRIITGKNKNPSRFFDSGLDIASWTVTFLPLDSILLECASIVMCRKQSVTISPTALRSNHSVWNSNGQRKS